jgi:hypothetical protein
MYCPPENFGGAVVGLVSSFELFLVVLALCLVQYSREFLDESLESSVRRWWLVLVALLRLAGWVRFRSLGLAVVWQ